MQPGDILSCYGVYGTGKTQLLIHLCKMLQGTQFKTLFVLNSKQALKSTIDLLKMNVTKLKDSSTATE